MAQDIMRADRLPDQVDSLMEEVAKWVGREEENAQKLGRSFIRWNAAGATLSVGCFALSLGFLAIPHGIEPARAEALNRIFSLGAGLALMASGWLLLGPAVGMRAVDAWRRFPASFLKPKPITALAEEEPTLRSLRVARFPQAAREFAREKLEEEARRQRERLKASIVPPVYAIVLGWFVSGAAIVQAAMTGPVSVRLIVPMVGLTLYGFGVFSLMSWVRLVELSRIRNLLAANSVDGNRYEAAARPLNRLE